MNSIAVFFISTVYFKGSISVFLVRSGIFLKGGTNENV
jgi:hypothetical protein